MKFCITIILLLLCSIAFSQSSEWFRKNYPIDYNVIRKDNHRVIKAKVIGIDKKTIKPDYLIKIEVDTVYSGKVDSSILLVNVAMPVGQVKKVYKMSEDFINSLQSKSIILNIWQVNLFKENDKHRVSKYWTSAYSFFINGLISQDSYEKNRLMAVFTDSPSLFIADIANFYNIEEITTAFYKAMKSLDCNEVFKFIQNYKSFWGAHRYLFLYSAAAAYISDCKCE